MYYVLCVRPIRTCLQCTKYFVHVMYMYTLTLSVQRTLCTYMHTLAFRYNVFCVCTCTHLPSVYNVLLYVDVYTYLRCIMHFVYVHVHLPLVCNVLFLRTCTHLPSVYNVFCLCTCTHLPSVYNALCVHTCTL